jgi:hypothetical protein
MQIGEAGEILKADFSIAGSASKKRLFADDSDAIPGGAFADSKKQACNQ